MYRKLLQSLFCFVLVLVVSAPSLSAAGKTVKVKVTLVSAQMVSNNHVGNEWWYGGYVNGQELDEGGSIVLNVSASGTVSLKAEAQEQDKYPDDGEAAASVKVASIGKGATKALNVTIVENRGRYSGNTAKWKFVFKVQKV
ncbi:hypothetical protein A8990_110129 [Paenibacillus taihuensis]|uniref:PLAT domain-containing protein n=1 Tax=Paenibacillus taihuensis TaxID=1156355 RepID=A0A3D9SD11_9BACL|nr:hypothetical protein [Paenibacillus taihuensis]REE86519.1 hypothetical protein A8990_110129 [Paenibacillus taihuensis]